MEVSNSILMESKGPPSSDILRTAGLSNEKPPCDRSQDRIGHTFSSPVRSS